MKSAQLISNQTNIFYLTLFKGVSDTEKEAYLLIVNSYRKPSKFLPERNQVPVSTWRSRRPTIFLFTSYLYLEQANLQINKTPPDGFKKQIRVIEISKDKPLSKQIKTILTKYNISALEYEPASLTVAEFQKLKKDLSLVKWSVIKKPIENQRQIKNPWEINQIKKAAKLTDQCFSFIVKRLTVGVTESQIAWEIEKFLREKGGQPAFSPIVAFGKNSSQPHYSPSANCQLQTADLVLLDFGAKVSGYCADMTRVIFFGKPSVLQQKVYKTVLSAQYKTINYITRFFTNHYNVSIHRSSQLSGANLDRVIKKLISDAGFPPFVHSLGHGLGLDIHEQPRLTIKKDALLKAGMVFTIEPAVYLPGQFGIRIEDTVLLNKDGLEILTQSPKESMTIK